MNSIDAAWLAGIIEGEGSLHISGDKARIQVAMTDEDVIVALRNKTGVGTIYGPYQKENFGSKAFWQWSVQTRADIHGLVTAILPFLFERRTIQAIAVLDHVEKLDAEAEQRKLFCRLGHNRADSGSNSRGDCLSCVAIWNSNKRAKYAMKEG